MLRLTPKQKDKPLLELRLSSQAEAPARLTTRGLRQDNRSSREKAAGEAAVALMFGMEREPLVEQGPGAGRGRDREEEGMAEGAGIWTVRGFAGIQARLTWQ